METFEKMKSELESFEVYKDTIYPDLSQMALEDMEWLFSYWKGKILFRKTEPTGYHIQGYRNREGHRVRYSVKFRHDRSDIPKRKRE